MSAATVDQPWQGERVSHADDLLRELYDAQWAPMVRLAAVLLGSSDHAEEVVQDAFVGIYRRMKRFDRAEDAVGYLRTSVVNGTRSVHRHREVVRRRPAPRDPVPAGPEEIAVAADDARQVMAALDSLPRRQREVLVLRYHLDATGPEIAATLGISNGAVKSHTHRGIAALRAALTPDPADRSDPADRTDPATTDGAS